MYVLQLWRVDVYCYHKELYIVGHGWSRSRTSPTPASFPDSCALCDCSIAVFVVRLDVLVSHRSAFVEA